MPTAPVAAASLVLGFAVAQATGVRPLGGAVLVIAVAWCFVRWHRAAGTPAAATLTLLYAGGFAAAHTLAHVLGAWGAVSAVAAVVAGAAWVVADRSRRRVGRPATR